MHIHFSYSMPLISMNPQDVYIAKLRKVQLFNQLQALHTSQK